MTFEEAAEEDRALGARVRLALAGGALATLTLRRGHDTGAGPYTVAVHVYAENSHPGHPEAGMVGEGTHRLGKGATLDEAMVAIGPAGAGSPGRGP